MSISMKKKSVFIGSFVVLLIAVFAGSVLAQTTEEDLIKDLRWRNIGPANMSGRVSDIEALDDDFTKVFVATASGGVWKSDNAGNSFEPIFDKYGAASIGDIAVFQKNPDIIWVGTGEECGRNSIAWGDGIYTDLWYTISTGDGYHVQVDPTDWRIIYSEPHPGNPGGRIQRENVETRQDVQIRPQKGENIVNYDEYIIPEMEQLQLEKGWGPSPGNGSGAFRWNWSSPIVMSPHNPHTIFFGANHLFKTIDQGDTWYLISPDLSKNDPYKTIKESGGLTPDHDPGGGAEKGIRGSW